MLSAQVQITASDLPSGPASYPVANALEIDLPDYDSPGGNQTWDFSMLTPINTENDTYVAISSAPFAYQFLFNNPFTPNYQATHAIEGEGIDLGFVSIDEFFFFFKNTPDQYTIVGYGGTLSGIPIPAQTNPIDVVYQLPINFGDEHASYSEWQVSLPTLGQYEQKQNRSYTVDAYGTVITPAGSFDALRMRMQIDTEDFIQIDGFGDGFTFERQSISYQWLTPGEGIPVLEVTEFFGQPTVRYKTSSTPVDVVDRPSDREVATLTPSLCTTQFKIHGAAKAETLQLFNSSGACVQVWNNQSTFDVSGLPAGCYIALYSVEGMQRSQRIMIQP